MLSFERSLLSRHVKIYYKQAIFITCVLTGLAVIYTYNTKVERKTMDSQDTMHYFSKADGLDITWYHRATDRARLEEALGDEGIMMIEADVLQWKLHSDPTMQPVMGHDVTDNIDLTLNDFLDTVIKSKKKKGIKLDFKQLEAVEPSLQMLQARERELHFPVWLNADVIVGPGATVPRVDGPKFVELANKYCPNFTLSLGWEYQGSSSTPLTKQMVQDMYDLVAFTRQPVTFAVNVAMFTSSMAYVSWLLHQQPDRFTVTLWTSMKQSQWEGASPQTVCHIRKELPKTAIYYDLSVHKDTWEEFLQLCGK